MADIPARVVTAALLASWVPLGVLTGLFIGRMAAHRDQQVPRDALQLHP